MLTLFPKQSPLPRLTRTGLEPAITMVFRAARFGLGLRKCCAGGSEAACQKAPPPPLRPSLQEPPLEGNRLFCRNCLDTWGTSDSASWGVSGSSFLGDFVASHCSIFWLLSLALSSFLSSKSTGSRHSGVYFQELFTTADGSVLSSVS